MKLLALDTSTRTSSVCILHDMRVRVEISLDIGQTHSRYVMAMIRDALDLGKCRLNDIDGFAVVSGPGSFTGLRIGLSTIKGLAVSGQKPIAAISSLEALAFQCRMGDFPVCVLLDARKKEVYSALYQTDRGRSGRIGDEKVGPLDRVIDGIDHPCWFIGDGALLYRERIAEQLGEKALFPEESEHRIRASSAAYLGLLKFSNHDVDSPETIVPHYIRSSDAQIPKPVDF